VVDDGSTDNTNFIASLMQKKFSNIKVFKKKNGGKASAINFGLLVSSGDIVVITDADGLISRDSLREIVGFFQDHTVVGVAGNIRVINKNNILTHCQAIEYSVGINLHRAATASFGVVEVLPGPLSAFRRAAIDRVGRFDSDTIVEDADFTKKLLKTGNVLQCTSKAFAYTEAPTKLRDFIKQRTRWYRGNIQTFLKHKDITDFSGNIFLSSVLYPLTFLQIFVQPWLGPLALVSFIHSVYTGNFSHIQNTFIIFIVIQVVISLIAIKKGDEELRLVLYSPFLIFGYKHLIDLIKIKCIIQQFTRKPAEWNKLERRGPEIKIENSQKIQT
jgi:cellulose synthase/poly-beta-1,6-N-acetylglucosamine synthase-like glycosyltransferase